MMEQLGLKNLIEPVAGGQILSLPAVTISLLYIYIFCSIKNVLDCRYSITEQLLSYQSFILLFQISSMFNCWLSNFVLSRVMINLNVVS